MSGGPDLAGLRVVFVLESLDLGGAERQAYILARHLAREQQAQVEVWSPAATGSLPSGRAAELFADEGIVCRTVRARISGGRLATARAVVALGRALRAAKADAILPYTLIPNVLSCAAGPWTGARLWIWNQRDVGIGSVGRRIERWAVHRARRIVANSRPGAGFLSSTFGIDPSRILLVPNAVEPPLPKEDRATWRARLGIGEEAFVFCMVANLHTNKDHVTLVHAMRAALDRWPRPWRPAYLLLAGRLGETHPVVSGLVKDLAVGERVRFLGPVNDIAGLLSASDAGVLSSPREGCPNGVLECMAAGLAVVGTDNDGIRDAVGPDGGQLLAGVGDRAGLANRLVLVAADEELRARIGAANRRRAAQEFSPARMYEAMTGLIAGACRAR